jgi:hypothetical protein
MLVVTPAKKKGGVVKRATPPPRQEGFPVGGEFPVKVDRFEKPAEAGFFVVEGPAKRSGSPMRCGLTGRARRLAMTLLDLADYMREVKDHERRLVLSATRRRVVEACRLQEELLAQGEQDVATTLTAALEQFRLAGAS